MIIVSCLLRHLTTPLRNNIIEYILSLKYYLLLLLNHFSRIQLCATP